MTPRDFYGTDPDGNPPPSLARLIQTARIHRFDVDLTADLITVHLRSELNVLHFFGSVSDPDATGAATCDGVAVRFTWPQARVPARTFAGTVPTQRTGGVG